MFSKEQLLFGLDLYGRENETDAILACANELDDPRFRERAEKVFRALYFGDPEVLEKLYLCDNCDKMFGPGMPRLTPLVLLYAAGKTHAENMRRLKFDEEQISRQKAAVDNIINIVHESGNTTALAWSGNFVRGHLIAAGVLQFQVPDPASGNVWIHIPGVSLKEEDVLRAVEESRSLLFRFYGIRKPNYLCESWLLSPGIHALSKPDSNIYRFFEHFDVTEGEDCRRDIRWNLFHVTDPDAPLPENTSLQKSVKKALAEGQHFFIGRGRWRE